MKAWMKIPLNLSITALISALSYVALVTILNKGVGLGEHMWQGFLYQVIFHFVFTFIALILVTTPLYIFLNKILENKTTSLIVGYISIFSVLFLLYVFIVSVDGYWLGVYIPCIVGVLSFSALEHLTNRSSRDRKTASRFSGALSLNVGFRKLKIFK